MPENDLKFKAVLALIGVLCVMAFYRMLYPSTTLAADGADPNWDAEVRQCKASGRPTVVLFTAGWCPACQALEGNILSRSDVQDEIDRHYNFYTVDLTNPSPRVQARSAKFGVRYIPLLIRYDADGKETDRTNYIEAEQLLAWLKAGE
jgi:thiol:disulfide interchange protein DsbD